MLLVRLASYLHSDKPMCFLMLVPSLSVLFGFANWWVGFFIIFLFLYARDSDPLREQVPKVQPQIFIYCKAPVVQLNHNIEILVYKQNKTPNLTHLACPQRRFCMSTEAYLPQVHRHCFTLSLGYFLSCVMGLTDTPKIRKCDFFAFLSRAPIFLLGLNYYSIVPRTCHKFFLLGAS